MCCHLAMMSAPQLCKALVPGVGPFISALDFPIHHLAGFSTSGLVCLYPPFCSQFSFSKRCTWAGCCWVAPPVMSDSLQPYGVQQARLPWPSPPPKVCPSSCPLHWWYHPAISSSDTPFSSCLQSFPASGTFPMSRLFASGGQCIGASASVSVLPIIFRVGFSLELTGLISLHSKRLSRVFSNTTIEKHQFFSTQPSLWSNSPSVLFNCSAMSNSLWPHGLQYARPPCPSPTPGAYSNSSP